MEPKTPEISKSPFHAKNYLNLEWLNRFNENLLPSNKAVLQRLIKIQQDSPKSTSIKSIATQRKVYLNKNLTHEYHESVNSYFLMAA